MKFFIDFEANQYTNEIIAIGCVAEDGTNFFSYVHSDKKITKFITSLTGITNETNNSARDSDEVFSDFFKWIASKTTADVLFYCYGTSDIDFIKKNLSKTHAFEAQAALSLIGMNMIDYAPTVKNHFGLIKNIKLIKVVSYYRDDPTLEQSHGALEDAYFLKEVFDHVENEGRVQTHPFPDYELKIENISNNPNNNGEVRNALKKIRHHIEVWNNDKICVATFCQLGDAVRWVMEKNHKGVINTKSKNRVADKIIRANLNNIQYCGFYWNIYIDNFDEEEEN